MLKHFNRPEFTDEFIANLKKEIPEAILQSRMDFDWDVLPQSDNYIRRVNNQRLRMRQRAAFEEEGHCDDIDTDSTKPKGRETSYDNWKDDPGERARRIWLWWIPRFEVEKSKLFHFALALRIIVLQQVSSAGVERVFSQLNYIVRICGTSMIEETLEMRLMHRCNQGLEDNYG
jgi:hypothetical protein